MILNFCLVLIIPPLPEQIISQDKSVRQRIVAQRHTLQSL